MSIKSYSCSWWYIFVMAWAVCTTNLHCRTRTMQSTAYTYWKWGAADVPTAPPAWRQAQINKFTIYQQKKFFAKNYKILTVLRAPGMIILYTYIYIYIWSARGGGVWWPWENLFSKVYNIKGKLTPGRHMAIFHDDIPETLRPLYFTTFAVCGLWPYTPTFFFLLFLLLKLESPKIKCAFCSIPCAPSW